MKKNYIFLALIVVVIAFGVMYLFHKKSEPLGDSLQPVRVGYVGHSLNYSPAMVAEEAGYFKEQNIALTPFKSSSETRLALATGKIDVAFLSFADTVVAISSGAPFVFVAPVTRASTVVFVRPGSFTTIQDLTGKKILGANGTSRFEFLHGAAEEGLKEGDFDFLDIDSDYAEIALLQKKTVDAVPTSRYKDASFIKAGAIPLPQWDEKYGKTFNPHTYLVANTAYLASHPQGVESVLHALIAADQMIQSKPQDAAELVQRHIALITGDATYTSDDVLRGWRESIQPVLWSDPGELAAIVDFLYETKQIKNKLSLDTVFDLRFQDTLQEAQAKVYARTR